jgi:serine/threonine protein kinase
MTIRAGSKIGGWTVEKKLGAAGQGEVFLVSRTQIDRTKQTAAIKIVRTDLIPKDAGKTRAATELRERTLTLAHEFEVLRKINNPCVSKALDSGFEESLGSPGFWWIATELIEGPSLDDEIRKYGPLAKQQWLELAHDILSGLASAHTEGIVHLDLKPANVMRDPRRSVLIDFGGASFVNIADAGDIGLMTPDFAAPEQLDSTIDVHDYEYPVDIFSAGVTLAYAATGWTPWDQLHHIEGNGQKIRPSDPRPRLLMDRQTNPPRIEGLDDDQKSILNKMLAFSPSERSTAVALLDEVRNMLPSGSSRKTGDFEYVERKVVSAGLVNSGSSNSHSAADEKRAAAIRARELEEMPRDWKIAFFLSLLIGFYGADRFYLGKYGTAFLKLGTAGGYLVWWVIDSNAFLNEIVLDAQGKPLRNRPTNMAKYRKIAWAVRISWAVLFVTIVTVNTILVSLGIVELTQ